MLNAPVHYSCSCIYFLTYYLFYTAVLLLQDLLYIFMSTTTFGMMHDIFVPDQADTSNVRTELRVPHVAKYCALRYTHT